VLDTESTVRTFWIPAFAGMTRVALLLSLFRDTTLVFGIVGSISLVMDRKMLLGIKQRAEAGAER